MDITEGLRPKLWNGNNCDAAGLGSARQGGARQGEARQGKARQGSVLIKLDTHCTMAYNRLIINERRAQLGTARESLRSLRRFVPTGKWSTDMADQ